MKTARPKATPTARLRECACGPMGGSPESGASVIRRVKVLGAESRNGRLYTAEARRKAVEDRVYEGAVVYFDHRRKHGPGEAPPDREFISKFGTLENVREEGDSVWADLRYNPRHLYAETLLGWIDADPRAFGLSHDVMAKRHYDGDTMVVTEIVEVHSVDLVADPATTTSLFESNDMDPLLTPEPPAGEAAESPKTLGQKIADLIAHIVDDAGMDPAQKEVKLKSVMKLLMANTGEDDAAAEPEESPIPVEEEEEEKEDMEKAEESIKAHAVHPSRVRKAATRILEAYKRERAKVEAFELKESRQRLEAKSRKMCADASLPASAITDRFVAVLTEARDDADRSSLIADRKSVMGVAKTPTSQAKAAPKDGKPTVADFLAAV